MKDRKRIATGRMQRESVNKSRDRWKERAQQVDECE